jgi:2'-5' RNA ligase
VTGDGKLRLFVAAELPDSIRDALTTRQQALRRRLTGDAVRWTRPEGMHLTLKFLGDVAGERLEALGDGLATALAGRQVLRLRLAGVGSFGGPRSLRVIWVGLDGDANGLAALAAAMDAALASLGFPRERRPFAGHLTLGRVRERVAPAARAALYRDLVAMPAPAPQNFRIEAVALVRIILGPGGACYQRLRVLPLG